MTVFQHMIHLNTQNNPTGDLYGLTLLAQLGWCGQGSKRHHSEEQTTNYMNCGCPVRNNFVQTDGLENENFK